jgi:hypothetical protein
MSIKGVFINFQLISQCVSTRSRHFTIDSDSLLSIMEDLQSVKHISNGIPACENQALTHLHAETTSHIRKAVIHFVDPIQEEIWMKTPNLYKEL